ncbi:MAG: hypothetical protein GY870_10840, partial [archaeon]|nr:hypothetical protein [archaeon]
MTEEKIFAEALKLAFQYLVNKTQLKLYDLNNEDRIKRNSNTLMKIINQYYADLDSKIAYLRTCPIFYEQFSVELCKKLPIFLYLAVKVNPDTLNIYLHDIQKKFGKSLKRNEEVFNRCLRPVFNIIFREYEILGRYKRLEEQIDIIIINLNPSIDVFNQEETFLSIVGVLRSDFIIEKLKIIKKEFKNIKNHKPSKLIRRISIILASLIYNDGISKKLMYRECDNIEGKFYLKGIEKFLPYIFEIDLPLEIFTGPGFDKLTAMYYGKSYNKLSAFLQFPGAARIIDFSKTFLSKNVDVRRWIALNPKAIEFDEFIDLLYPETESDKIVRINAFQTLRNNEPNRFKEIKHKIGSKREIKKFVELETLPKYEKEALIEIMYLLGEKFSFESKPMIYKNYKIENGHIVELFLFSNKLKSIPESIGCFKKLKTLIINDNYLKSLPNSISNLELLEILSLKHNKFQTIPKVVFQLTSLKKLNLGYNELIFLPE